MTARVMTIVQFAKEFGGVTDYDVQGHIHGGLMAAHMPNSYHRRYQARLRELQDQRDETARRYAEAIARGEIAPPPKLTHRERLEIAAAGDPDFPSTQAARRVLERLKAREELKE